MINQQAILDFFKKNKQYISSNSDDNIVIDGGSVAENLLKTLGFDYTNTRDGFILPKKQNNDTYIFLNYESCVGFQYITKNINEQADILIITENKFIKANIVLNNLSYFSSLLDIIKKNNIADYIDTANENLVFLSPSIGRVDVGYSNIGFSSKFFEEYKEVNILLDRIANELNHIETQSIFRDCIARLFTQNPKVEKNIIFLLTNIDFIYDDFQRNINLYKNKYSFDKFVSDFDKQKEEYIKHYSDFFATIISKLYAIPIQIAGYVLLLSRTENKTLWEFIALLVVIFIGVFANFIYKLSIDNTKYFKEDFEIKTNEIIAKTKINDSSFDNGVKKIQSKIDKLLKALNVLKTINCIITVTFISISLYLLCLN